GPSRVCALPLHDALPISVAAVAQRGERNAAAEVVAGAPSLGEFHAVAFLAAGGTVVDVVGAERVHQHLDRLVAVAGGRHQVGRRDRKSTRLNSSHVKISY